MKSIRKQIDIIEEDGDEYFLITSPDVPGLVAEGRTEAEALEIAASLIPSLLTLSRCSIRK